MIRAFIRSGVAALAVLAVAGCRGPGAQPAASAPEQPILFMHSVHAGENQIPCAYCHYSADRSVDAGIPAVAVQVVEAIVILVMIIIARPRASR